MPRLWLSLAVASLVAGCAYGPGDLDNPIQRKFTWFSFLDAADIRAACDRGAPDTYRIVHNANWERQVRIYELGVAGRADLLRERVLGPPSLVGVDLREPLQPWRGAVASAILTPEARARLVESLAASGAFAPPPVGLRLPSDRHYWIVAACHGGQFHYNAWLHPSPRYDALTFDAVLARLGPSREAFEPAPAGLPLRLNDPDDAGRYFTIEVGRTGLKGI